MRESVRALCPRHPHKTARGRCAECRHPYCARCEFRTEHRFFCGPACAREHQRRKDAPGRASRRGAAIGAIAAGIAAAAAAILLARLPRPAPAGKRPAVARAVRPPAPGPAVPAIPAAPPPAPRVVTPAALPSRRAPRPPEPAEPPLRAAEEDADKRIVVSFDAGSSDRGAAEILDALRGRGIRTTIFLTGQFIRRYPELTRRIAEDGHEVGNHTWDHPHLTTYASDGRQSTRPGVTEEMLRGELLRTAALYRETTGREMAPLWRAPFGEENAEIRAWALRAGFSHVSWTHGGGRNLDALDWVSDPESPRYRPSDRLISRLLASARPGNIILMHLGSDREDPVADHLPRLLDTLASEGYRFSTASELIAAGRPSR